MTFLKTSLLGIAGAVFTLLSSASVADPGHNVPTGVSQDNHLHIFGDMIVAPSRLVGAGVIVLIVLALVVRRLRIRANKD